MLIAIFSAFFHLFHLIISLLQTPPTPNYNHWVVTIMFSSYSSLNDISLLRFKTAELHVVYYLLMKSLLVHAFLYDMESMLDSSFSNK